MSKSNVQTLSAGAISSILMIGAAALSFSASCAWATSTAAADKFGEPPQMTEAAAKKLIMDDKYADVTNMHKVSDGWAASAKSLGSPVSLVVTNMGVVDQQ